MKAKDTAVMPPRNLFPGKIKVGLTVRAPQELIDTLNEIADDIGWSRGDLVNFILNNWLESHLSAQTDLAHIIKKHVAS